MKVTLVARTRAEFDGFMSVWESEGDSAQDLSEFAGRACYQSWARPNPATATNAGYLAHILEVEHHSVLEHGSVSFYVEGVSRSLTHELVRHRHLSPSQLSQRFVVVRKTTHGRAVPFVIPPLLEGDQDAAAVLSAAWDYAVHAYDRLIEIGNRIVGDMEDVAATTASKRVREAARAVLPNMTPTAIVITGNHRSWLEFVVKRGALEGPDAEIRRLAVELFRQLRQAEPNIYQRLTIFNTGEYEWIGQV